MSDRQQLTSSLVVAGSLGHFCLSHEDCITKHAICRQSGSNTEPNLTQHLPYIVNFRLDSMFFEVQLLRHAVFKRKALLNFKGFLQ
jgi:hypothetical protein